MPDQVQGNKSAIVILDPGILTSNWKLADTPEAELQATSSHLPRSELRIPTDGFPDTAPQLATIVPLTVDGCQLISVCTLPSPSELKVRRLVKIARPPSFVITFIRLYIGAKGTVADCNTGPCRTVDGSYL